MPVSNFYTVNQVASIAETRADVLRYIKAGELRGEASTSGHDELSLLQDDLLSFLREKG
jgi:hypothetical protein